MVHLRSCYFCGTTDALSEYETLPKTLRGAADASRRVVLCDRCHAKLTNVLAPIVDRLDHADAGESPPSDAGDGSSPPDDGRESVGSAGDRPTQTSVTFAEASEADGDTAGTAAGTDRSTDQGGGSTDPGERTREAAGTPPSDVTDAGVASSNTTGPAGTTDAPPGSEGTVEPSGTTDDGSADHTGDGDVDATEADESSPGADDGGKTGRSVEGSTPRDDLDRVYRKLLRFLRNREFPIPRAEAEAVAQSAYDLDADEATRVVQRAVDRGVLDEHDGELHRT